MGDQNQSFDTTSVSLIAIHVAFFSDPDFLILPSGTHPSNSFYLSNLTSSREHGDSQHEHRITRGKSYFRSSCYYCRKWLSHQCGERLVQVLPTFSETFLGKLESRFKVRWACPGPGPVLIMV